MIVRLNDVEINAEDITVDSNEKGEQEVELEFYVIGKSDCELWKSFFSKKVYNVIIPDKNIEQEMILENTSYSYKGILDETSEVRFKIVLRTKTDEYDELDPLQKMQVALTHEIMLNAIKFKALLMTLEEQGIVDVEAVEAKFNEIADEEKEKILNKIFPKDIVKKD